MSDHEEDWSRPQDPPILGTLEARERLRRSGVPLDEWVAFDSPTWRAQMERRHRTERRFDRIAVALLVAVLGGLMTWGVLHPEPLPSERMPTCASEVGLPCRFERSDGVLMVRWRHPERGVEVSTAADFDESYLSWLEDMAPGCPWTGIGPSSGC